MSTARRFWCEGASYHIVNRGNRKEKIFLEEIDYGIYLYILKNTLNFYKDLKYKIMGYCLMSNHIHLLMKTESESPAKFMRRANSLYATYFNKKYDKVGHLFQGRYYSNLIESDVEMLVVSKYIHLNPVRAKIVSDPMEYKWSSYRKTVYKQNEADDVLYVHSDKILDILDIYTVFDQGCYKNKNKYEKYKKYIEIEEKRG